MNGIVFTKFIEMVEERFGLEVLDHIIADSELPSKGAYTSIGTYDFFEVESLILNLNKRTLVPIEDLYHIYCDSILNFFASTPPAGIEKQKSTAALFFSLESPPESKYNSIRYKTGYLEPKLEKKVVNFSTMKFSCSKSRNKLVKALLNNAYKYKGQKERFTYGQIKTNGNQVKFKVDMNSDEQTN